MSLLDLNTSNSDSGNKKILKTGFTFSVVLLIFALGSTLAANINLNSGGNVEFGQGVVQATACDNEITITPYSSFVNELGAGTHYLTSLRISGIDSSDEKCSGKTFVIKAYGDSGLLDLFNYTVLAIDPATIIQDEDFNSVEITNEGGEFTWTSGGTDGDDVTDVDNETITETAFTLNLLSVSTTVERTPLAIAEDVKKITVETYDRRELSGRTLSSSQIGFIAIPGLSEIGFEILTEDVPSCEFLDCAPYYLLQDWIDRIPDEDVDYLNEVFLESYGITTETPLNRDEIGSLITARFEYDSSAEEGQRWILTVLIGSSELTSSESGEVWGFDGSIGVFIPHSFPQPIVFSVNSSLTSNSTIGTFTPYTDQSDRNIPLRNLLSVWTYSENLYVE